MLQGKHIVLGVTGSIAAFKIASLASMLKKQKADVTVIMTQNAVNFINPITFESLTGCFFGCAGIRQCDRKGGPRDCG